MAVRHNINRQRFITQKSGTILDKYRIWKGPIIPTVWPIGPDWQNTVSTPSISSPTQQRTRTSRRPITSSSRTPSSSSTTEETTTIEEIEEEGESTMQMAPPKLYLP
uniref:Candidate secreted effector n=1 Tax=Meloidogyne incognita TaxID=6306 RepID=A0A914KY54_MELIC